MKHHKIIVPREPITATHYNAVDHIYIRMGVDNLHVEEYKCGMWFPSMVYECDVLLDKERKVYVPLKKHGFIKRNLCNLYLWFVGNCYRV